MVKDLMATPDLQQIALYPLVVQVNQKHLITQSVETLLAISHSIENVVMENRVRVYR